MSTPAQTSPSDLKLKSLGMAVFLVSLAVFFIAGIIGYLIIRKQNPDWIPTVEQTLPIGLWISTVLLGVCSGTIHCAYKNAEKKNLKQTKTFLILTSLFTLGFIASQIQVWYWVADVHSGHLHSLFAFTFYSLTGMHALHVIGGLVPLFGLTIQALAGADSEKLHSGTKLCAMYWHFLDGVWLVLVGILWTTT